VPIEHIIFLIHPCGYEEIAPEVVRERNYELFVAREQECKRRWLAGIEAERRAVLLLQLYGSRRLFEAACARLGEAHACYVHAEYPGEGQLREYYRRLVTCIREHMKRFALEFDPATVTSELWGGSFEGCAAGYGGAFAEHLGLKRPPKADFGMMVYDSRFLHGARRWEVIPIAGSDVEAVLFECHDGSPAAIFQARLTAQWLDKRPIRLLLDANRIQVCTKMGFTVWPASPPPPRAEGQDVRPFELTTSDQYWVRGVNLSLDALRQTVSSAAVAV
jgi:hypothetical protein